MRKPLVVIYALFASIAFFPNFRSFAGNHEPENCGNSLMEQTLNENLMILKPMLCKNWIGDMKSPDGKQTFKVSLSYEAIWNGEAIKFSRSIPERNGFSEGYFYWDVNEKKIISLSISNRGGAMKAEVSIEDGKITLKGVATIQNRTFDYKNTFEFSSDGKMIDRWFQNASGQWSPGHVIEFVKND